MGIFDHYTHEVDFGKGIVMTYHDIRHGMGAHPTEQTIYKWKGVKHSKIPVNSIKDIYDILTYQKSLGIILDQYIQDKKREGEGNYYGIDSKSLKKMKRPIIEYLISLKDKIKIDELKNVKGKNLEEEKEDVKKQLELVKWLEKNVENFDPSRIGSDKCRLCGQFSNIHCINCDIWICGEHLKEHGLKGHNYKTLDQKDDPQTIRR